MVLIADRYKYDQEISLSRDAYNNGFVDTIEDPLNAPLSFLRQAQNVVLTKYGFQSRKGQVELTTAALAQGGLISDIAVDTGPVDYIIAHIGNKLYSVDQDTGAVLEVVNQVAPTDLTLAACSFSSFVQRNRRTVYFVCEPTSAGTQRNLVLELISGVWKARNLGIVGPTTAIPLDPEIGGGEVLGRVSYIITRTNGTAPIKSQSPGTPASETTIAAGSGLMGFWFFGSFLFGGGEEDSPGKVTLDLSGLAAGDDDQVTHYAIYRTSNLNIFGVDPTIYRLVDFVVDGTASYVDVKSDEDLSLTTIFNLFDTAILPNGRYAEITKQHTVIATDETVFVSEVHNTSTDADTYLFEIYAVIPSSTSIGTFQVRPEDGKAITGLKVVQDDLLITKEIGLAVAINSDFTDGSVPTLRGFELSFIADSVGALSSGSITFYQASLTKYFLNTSRGMYLGDNLGISPAPRSKDIELTLRTFDAAKVQSYYLDNKYVLIDSDGKRALVFNFLNGAWSFWLYAGATWKGFVEGKNGSKVFAFNEDDKKFYSHEEGNQDVGQFDFDRVWEWTAFKPKKTDDVIRFLEGYLAGEFDSDVELIGDPESGSSSTVLGRCPAGATDRLAVLFDGLLRGSTIGIQFITRGFFRCRRFNAGFLESKAPYPAVVAEVDTSLGYPLIGVAGVGNTFP